MATEKSLQKQCERLRARLEEKERQQARDRRKLAAVKKARDTYRLALTALLREQYPDDPEVWARELKTAIPFADLIAELDEIADQKKKSLPARQRRPA